MQLSQAHIDLHRAVGLTSTCLQPIGGRDGVLVSLVRLLQSAGRDSRLLAHLEQHLVFCHIHMGRQTGCAVLMSHQSLQCPRVDVEGTAAMG